MKIHKTINNGSMIILLIENIDSKLLVKSSQKSPVVGSSSTSPSQFKKHVRLECKHPGCSYSTFLKGNFIAHQRTHTGNNGHY